MVAPPQAVSNMSLWRAIESGGAYRVLQISDTPLGVDQALWSPDGSRLLVHMATGSVDPMLRWAQTTPLVLSPDGSGWHVGGWGNSPNATYNAWSPDGAQLAYIAGDEVWLANADGSDARLLPSPPGSSPAALQVSPQGNWLAVLVSRRVTNDWLNDLWLYDTLGAAHSLLIEDAGGFLGHFSWAPQGDAVARGRRTARAWQSGGLNPAATACGFRPQMKNRRCCCVVWSHQGAGETRPIAMK